MLQDVEMHREVALEYVKYFENTLLPSKTSDAPKGTRLERVEVCCRIHFNNTAFSAVWHVCIKSSCNRLPEV